MFDKNENKIYFPHTIPGNILDGKTFEYNDIKEGVKPIANLGLVQNSFFGGNVKAIGFMSEYGFYICPSYWNKKVLGFYVDDPSALTEKGKKILEDRFKGVDIVYEKYDPDSKKMTETEKKRREELKQEALEVGLASDVVTRATANELRSLIDAFESGSNEKPIASLENNKTSYSTEPRSKVKQTGRKPNVKGTMRKS